MSIESPAPRDNRSRGLAEPIRGAFHQIAVELGLP